MNTIFSLACIEFFKIIRTVCGWHTEFGKTKGQIEWQKNWRKADNSMLVLMTRCNSHVKVNVNACRGHCTRDIDPLHTPSCSIIPHVCCARLLKFQSCFHYSSVCLASVLPAHRSCNFLRLVYMFIRDMLPSRCQLGHGTRKLCARQSVSKLPARSLIKAETSLRAM
jgi:hypothetical protein